MTIKLNTTATTAIYNVATASCAEERAIVHALPILRQAFAGCERDAVRDTIMVEFAHAVRVELKVQGTGRLVWPAGSDTAKRACNRFIQRVLADDKGNAGNDRTEVKVPRHIAEMARALAEACAEYEGARKLASTAVAQAFAK